MEDTEGTEKEVSRRACLTGASREAGGSQLLSCGSYLSWPLSPLSVSSVCSVVRIQPLPDGRGFELIATNVTRYPGIAGSPR